jgi:peptidoglycan/LPS O-acetylase OafA/YrhL
MGKLTSCILVGGIVGLLAGPIVGKIVAPAFRPPLPFNDDWTLFPMSFWMSLAGPTAGMLAAIVMCGSNRRKAARSFELLLIVGLFVGALLAFILPDQHWSFDGFVVYGAVPVSTMITALISAFAVKVNLVRREDAGKDLPERLSVSGRQTPTTR